MKLITPQSVVSRILHGQDHNLHNFNNLPYTIATLHFLFMCNISYAKIIAEHRIYIQKLSNTKVGDAPEKSSGMWDCIALLSVIYRLPVPICALQKTVGGKKDRSLFLFSDLIICTTLKRKSGSLRRSSMSLYVLKTQLRKDVPCCNYSKPLGLL